MMDLCVNIVAQKVLGGPSEHFLRSAVDKGCLTVGVDPVDPFASGVQDQLVFALEICKEALRALLFNEAAVVDFSGLNFSCVLFNGLKIKHMK